MVVINIISALSNRGGIGLKNKIPWSLGSDLKNFKKLTIGKGNNSVIMGRRTWESLNCNHLKGRKNIVISSKLSDKNNNIKVVSSLSTALKYSDAEGHDVAWIIGGSGIYDEAISMNNVTGIYLTRVNTDVVCDTFFPHINKLFTLNKTGEWQVEDGISFRYENYLYKALKTQIHF